MNKLFRMRILLIIIIIINSIKVLSQQAYFYDQKVKNVTYGSNLYDEGKEIYRSGKNVYVFGNTRSTTINNDVQNVYGLGDVFIEKYDSSGNVSYKTIGGGGLDILQKVEQDDFGFWLYIKSKSGISGTRTKPLTCYPYTYEDIWIVRLDKNLNQVNDYSMCLDYMHINITDNYISGFELNKINNTLKFIVVARDTITTPYSNYLIITDTVGFVLNKIYLGRAQKLQTVYQGSSSVTSVSKYYMNKIITQSDSITILLQDLTHNINFYSIPYTPGTKYYYSAGNVIRLNTVTKKMTNIVIKTTKSDTKINTGLYKNGKLYVYSNCIPSPSTGRNLDSLFLNSYPVRINRTFPARTINNKSDVWCVVFDSLSMTYQGEYAIGSNDSTLINGAFIYNDKIHLNLSSKGGISFDKTLGSKGGYDYWLVNLSSNNISPDKQILFGGSKDDYLFGTNIENGSMFLCGTSKSSTGGDRTAVSRDGNLYGDSWTQVTCFTPIINYSTNSFTYTNGSLLTITNNSQNAINFNWSFLDNTNSYTQSTEYNPSTYLYNSDTLKIIVVAKNYNCSHIGISYVIVEPFYVGINENSKEKYIVYPNPFMEFIYVKSEYGTNYNYELYNIYGELVLSGITNNNDGISTEKLVPGSYVLTIKQNEKSINYKLIKQ